MISFGSGISVATTATMAAHEAATKALAMYGPAAGQAPKLAVVFASATYEDVEQAARAVRGVVGDAQIVGGTSGGCVFDGDTTARRGVSVVLIGGDSIEVRAQTAQLGSPSFVETVPAAERVARAADDDAARGFEHFACLVFAPGLGVDGEALVAAVRKGAGARAQLAGALTGDDRSYDRAKVYFGDELRDDCVVLAGLFTTKPVGIAARHGWSAVGPVRTVTRADGFHLFELDERPALEVWLEDARNAGGTPPVETRDIVAFLADHYELGIADESASRLVTTSQGAPRELAARAPLAIREDGALRLSASISEGSHVRVLHASRDDLLRASADAATAAADRAGHPIAGALVLACAGRLSALGESFPHEPAQIRARLEAPVGGASVFGEIARNLRDADAFFNITTVIIAFSA